jgi:hypothetical protein
MCDVGYFVEGEEGGGPLMLHVACNTGRNMGSLGTVSGEEGGGSLMLDVTHSMLTTWTPWVP